MAPVVSKHRPPLERARSPRDTAISVAHWVQPTLERLLEALQASVEGGEAFFLRAREELRRGFRYCAAVVETVSLFSVKSFWRRDAPPLVEGLPPCFVVHIIAMLYNAFVFGYMPAAGLAMNSPTSLLFHAIIFLMLGSFMQVLRTDPGTVPETAAWQRKDFPPPVITETKTSTGKARWCHKNSTYKPDRAHNCSVLGKCVLRMDHHCPWLGNTIGFFNHKFFWLFLFYANAACGMLGISIFQLLTQMALPSLTTFLLLGVEGLVALLASILLPFFLFHCRLLATNTTTIELWEQPLPAEEKKDEESGIAKRTSVYDVGLFNNICSVMGDNPLLWLCPIGGPSGDGLSFPRNDNAPRIAASLSSAQVCCVQKLKPETPAKSFERERGSTSEASTADPSSSSDAESEELSVDNDDLSSCAESEDHGVSDVESGTPTVDRSPHYCAWEVSAKDIASAFALGCQTLGESLVGSAGHVTSILTCSSKAKRASIRRGANEQE